MDSLGSDTYDGQYLGCHEVWVHTRCHTRDSRSPATARAGPWAGGCEMSSRPSPQGRFCHLQVHTWKHRQTGLRDLSRDGESSSSPWDTERQGHAMYHVGGWAFSALARWRLLGSLHRGAALCLAADVAAFLGSTCQAPAASPAPAGTHWVTSAPVPLTRAHDSRQQATPKANARRASSPVALSQCGQVENTVPPSRSQVTLLARTCQDKGTSPHVLEMPWHGGSARLSPPPGPRHRLGGVTWKAPGCKEGTLSELSLFLD